MDAIEAALQKLADDEEDHGPFLYARKIKKYLHDHVGMLSIWGEWEWMYVEAQIFNAKIMRGPHHSKGFIEESW